MHNIRLKRICTLTMGVLLLLSILSTTVFGAVKINTEADVSLQITYKDGEMPLSDATFDVYKVASVDEFARMTLTPDFERYKTNIEGLSALEEMTVDSWQNLATTLKPYVHADGISPTTSGKTDTDGTLSLSLKAGLYLVVGKRITASDYYTYTCSPFMAFLPDESDTENAWVYNMSVEPKFQKSLYPDDDDNDNFITRKVLVVWDDEGHEDKRPESVTVKLLCDGVENAAKILKEEDLWRTYWDNLDKNHEWELVENFINGYYTSIEKKGITFVVKNKFIEAVNEKGVSGRLVISGDTPKEKSNFDFVMKADNSAYPMPSGSENGEKKVSLKGEGSIDFGNITFTKAGTYTYKVSQVIGNTKGYSYDKTVYSVTFTVTENSGILTVNRKIINDKGTAASYTDFKNVYKNTALRPANNTGDNNKILPQTGAMWWPVPVLMLAGIALIAVGSIRRGEKKHEEK